MGLRLAAVSLAQLVSGAFSECDGNSGTCAILGDASSLLQLQKPLNLEPTRASLELGQKADAGIVDELYTYGAPGTATPALTDNMHGGIFPGVRTYTEDIVGGAPESKRIDAAAIFNTFTHARTATLDLHRNQSSYFEPGHPEWPQRAAGVYASWPLHMEPFYINRFKAVTLDGKTLTDYPEVGRAGFFAELAFRAYNTTEVTKLTLTEHYPGWRMVADEVLITGVGASYDEDPVRLYQNQDNLECALVFTGTNSNSDISNNINTAQSDFCGFNGVHQGYRDKVLHITANLWPLLRPKLAKCAKVNAIGHSLGGAVAEIFAACANSGSSDDPGYKQQAWVKEEPALLPETGMQRHEVASSD